MSPHSSKSKEKDLPPDQIFLRVTTTHLKHLPKTTCFPLPFPMRLPGRVIGLLKEYMHDLVEQATQEETAQATFGFAMQPYRPDQAISDLLAILDDRIESEGVQVGLSVDFLHQMWTLCNSANAEISNIIWLKKNIDGGNGSKAEVRKQTYDALVTYLESLPEDHQPEDPTPN